MGPLVSQMGTLEPMLVRQVTTQPGSVVPRTRRSPAESASLGTWAQPSHSNGKLWGCPEPCVNQGPRTLRLWGPHLRTSGVEGGSTEEWASLGESLHCSQPHSPDGQAGDELDSCAPHWTTS